MGLSFLTIKRLLENFQLLFKDANFSSTFFQLSPYLFDELIGCSELHHALLGCTFEFFVGFVSEFAVLPLKIVVEASLMVPFSLNLFHFG